MPVIHIPPKGDAHYPHTQSTPSAVWTVNHNLGKRPAVSAEDSSGAPVEGVVSHLDENTLTITFSAAFGGVAYLN